jgi:hypothetical protein
MERNSPAAEVVSSPEETAGAGGAGRVAWGEARPRERARIVLLATAKPASRAIAREVGCTASKRRARYGPRPDGRAQQDRRARGCPKIRARAWDAHPSRWIGRHGPVPSDQATMFTLNPAVGLSRFGRFWREDNPRWLIKPGSTEAAGPIADL